MNNDKNLPTGIKHATQMGKDVLILDNKISVFGLSGNKESIYYVSFCFANYKTNKGLLKITYYNKAGLIKFEEICHKDKAIKRLSQLKEKIIDLRIP